VDADDSRRKRPRKQREQRLIDLWKRVGPLLSQVSTGGPPIIAHISTETASRYNVVGGPPIPMPLMPQGRHPGPARGERGFEQLLRFAPGNLRPFGRSLTKPNTFRHNQPASVASLRRLFAFTGTPFGFPLESPFTFTESPP
jgi:hypothetical protein